MARRTSKVSAPRAAGALTRRHPPSTSTSKSSEQASTNVSEIEVEDSLTSQIIALTLDVPLRPFRRPRRIPATPFHFLSLPSEIRIRIYEYYFNDVTGAGGDPVIDLCPDNQKRIHKRLLIMKVCKQLHDEATYFLYSSRRFRIFPTYPGRYFKSKKPLLSRLKPLQRERITSLELRLGPGWNAPPKGWVVNDALGLNQCLNVHTLNVFVECDPSDSIFKGFRRAEGFYEGFSRQLLTSVLDVMPFVQVIEFDAWPSVKKSGAMMQGLLDVAAQTGRLISWGPERGWTDDMEEDDIMEGPALMDGVPIPGYPTYNFVAVA